MKTGEALPELRVRGDFEDWIVRGLGVPSTVVDVWAPVCGEPLPDPGGPAGIVVTGSSAMVSAREPWSERTAAWLARTVRAGTPLLGICYGHQLLAHGLGGAVGPNPRGREIGTVEVRVREPGRSDPLLGVLGARALVHATHVESVLALPPGGVPLAGSDADPHQAFAVGDRAWGVQFHPEFDAATIRGYLEARRADLQREGLDADALLARVREAPAGPRLLRRFAALCG